MSLSVTLDALPKQVAGFDGVEVLIIDDGSTDGTVAVAKKYGVAHILARPHEGLAQTFQAGLQYALQLSADVIVNLDADNQYRADDIAALVSPIVKHDAHVVIGQRDFSQIATLPLPKKCLHWIGSRILAGLLRFPVTDVSSGFRAIHRDAAMQLTIDSQYSYTVEMIMHLHFKQIPTRFVPIHVNPVPLRPSRLIRNHLIYLIRQGATIMRTYWHYRPIHVVAGCSVLLALFLWIS